MSVSKNKTITLPYESFVCLPVYLLSVQTKIHSVDPCRARFLTASLNFNTVLDIHVFQIH